MTNVGKHESEKPERLFDEMLNTTEFRLVKFGDGWGLVDETGTNLGDIEADRFDGPEGIIDRLDIYVTDYFTADIKDVLDIDDCPDLSAFLKKAVEVMAPEMREHYSFELEVLDMICNHPGEIDLEKCQFTVEEDISDEC